MGRASGTSNDKAPHQQKHLHFRFCYFFLFLLSLAILKRPGCQPRLLFEGLKMGANGSLFCPFCMPSALSFRAYIWSFPAVLDSTIGLSASIKLGSEFLLSKSGHCSSHNGVEEEITVSPPQARDLARVKFSRPGTAAEPHEEGVRSMNHMLFLGM